MATALDNPRLLRHMELYHSNCGDPKNFGLVPSPGTSISNRAFEKGFVRRPLLPFPHGVTATMPGLQHFLKWPIIVLKGVFPKPQNKTRQERAGGLENDFVAQ